jgi:hypothetical protein
MIPRMAQGAFEDHWIITANAGSRRRSRWLNQTSWTEGVARARCVRRNFLHLDKK